jgi:hypothetical protein
MVNIIKKFICLQPNFIMNKDLENKMVKNVNFVPMTREITIENAALGLKRLENLSFFKSMSEEGKKSLF